MKIIKFYLTTDKVMKFLATTDTKTPPPPPPPPPAFRVQVITNLYFSNFFKETEQP